jgi:hypothetical protein
LKRVSTIFLLILAIFAWGFYIHSITKYPNKEVKAGPTQIETQNRDLGAVEVAKKKGRTEPKEDGDSWFSTEVFIAIFTGVLTLITFFQLQSNWQQADLFRRTERAWVSFEGVKFEGTTNVRVLYASWKNFGRTPAINVEMYKDIRIVGVNDAIPYFNPPNPDGPRQTLSIGAGYDITSPDTFVPVDVWMRVRNGQAKLFFYSRIKYGSIFEPNKQKISEFCGYAHIRRVDRTSDGNEIEHVSFRPIGSQNGTT